MTRVCSHMQKQLMLCLALMVTPVAQAETLNGTVVAISDGDTLTLLDKNHQQHKIRLMGIDAPESHQAFGQKSKTHLSNLVFKREVSAECGKTDIYRRQVCKIRVNGIDANLEQVKAGMAWWYRSYSREQLPQDREDYEAAEVSAKSQGLGLWSEKNPIPPWEWRKR